MDTVFVARERAELMKLRPEWEALAAQAIEPNPFYEPWFLLPALGDGAGEARLECVVVRVEGTLAGLFPFTRRRGYKGLPFSVLSSWRHNSSLLCTPLVRADCAEACLQALLAWLQNDGKGASAAEFRYVPSDGPFWGALADVLRKSRSMVVASDGFTRALLRKAPDAERYLQGALSGKSRKALRRKEKKLLEKGALVRVALQTGENAGPWIAQFLALEASGWKGRRGTALACSPSTRTFASRMLSEAHERGRLQLIGLDCGERPVARCVNLVAGKGVYAYRSAYDEEFAEFSPGMMAEIECIRAFHAMPHAEFMDSITDPDNSLMNRLWTERRMVQSVIVGAGAWGELWVSMLPLLRWARTRISPKRTEPALGRAGYSADAGLAYSRRA